MPENIIQALTVLVTGFVVVFAVLILLIAIIKIYSTIVYNALNKPKKEKKNKDDDDTPKGTGAGGSNKGAAPNGAVSPEVLACIAAAVEFMYGAGNVRIKNIRKVPRKAWGSAGVSVNTRPF